MPHLQHHFEDPITTSMQIKQIGNTILDDFTIAEQPLLPNNKKLYLTWLPINQTHI